MPRVTAEGKIPIPESVREGLGVGPGDEVVLKSTESGYVVRKAGPRTEDGADPFEKYRGSADSDDTMSERMRRLRDRQPPSDGSPIDRD